MALTGEQVAVLDFEREWWMLPGPKEKEIRERLQLSPTRYYKVLADLLDDSDAMAYDPLVVRRARRMRERRRRARVEGRSAEGPPAP